MPTNSFKIPGRNPLVANTRINITYDDVLAMSDAAFMSYVQDMRSYIRTLWDEQGIAPSTGWDEDDVRNDFAQMASFPVHTFWRTCEATGRRVIHNTHTMGNSVNAWNLHRMLKVRINYTEKDNGRSIYDFFAKDELFDKYKPYARRHILRDSFYFFAQTVKKGDSLPHRRDVVATTADEYCRRFAEHERPYNTHELLIEAKRKDKEYSGYAEHLRDATFFALSFANLRQLMKDGVITPLTMRVVRKKEFCDDYEFHVRMYQKGQKLFPSLFKSFRVSMCQYAVNFPPLTAKLIYETFLKHVKNERVVVWDPSSGWAGRILGAMSSELGDRRLHYIGTDPNPEFYEGNESVYATIADFYNGVRKGDSLFDDATHTHEIYCSGSETVQFNPNFQQWKGKLDLVFTSPPYFAKEAYSEDENQSYKRFAQYEAWREGFLRETLKTAYDWLAPDRYLVWNIADVQFGKRVLPLQQDSIDICKELGFEFVETTGMTLRGMPGANRIDENGNLTTRNTVKIAGTPYKYEPFLVFRKP